MSEKSARRAGIYVRISSDPSGQRLGVTRQLDACRAKAEALGWAVVGVYEDNDVSATGRTPRPRYEAMLTDLEAARLDAVVVWDLDRLTRRPIEIEHFIDLADRRGVALASVGGDVDLATDNGRLFARIKGAVARSEVERKSARQRAAGEQRRAAGLQHVGRRAFGHTRDGRGLEEAEAAWVRKGVAALLAGESVGQITRAFNEAGLTTTAGGPWRTTELRRMLRNPRHAGLLTHVGVVVGEGAWEPIISVDDHRAVCAVLDDPARHTARARVDSALLVGVATCGRCGAAIYSTRSGDRPRYYYCSSRRHLTRAAAAVDDYITDVILERLTRTPVDDLLDPTDPALLANLRTEEAALRARLDGVADAYAAGDVDELQLRRVSNRLRGRLDEIAAELTSLTRRPDLATILDAADVTAGWAATPPAGRTRILAALAAITIHAPGRGARRFDPATVEVRWR